MNRIKNEAHPKADTAAHNSAVDPALSNPTRGSGTTEAQVSDSVHGLVLQDTSAKHGRSVLLWDTVMRRRALIRGIIRDTGGRVHIFEADERANLGEPPTCVAVGIIAVGDASKRDNPSFERIARHKRAGSLVIAYEDGVNQWPVGCKCRPLLAGAAYLLDSASAGFAEDLCRVLEQAFQAMDDLYGEQQKLRTLMHEHGIVGESAAMTDAFRLAMRFSQFSDLPVLITGESGTGKELMAKAISKMDPKRRDKPFLGINCSAIQPTILESELFGHRRGAFTGAERDRKGWIRSAEGGVLFLDEIGEMEGSKPFRTTIYLN